MADNVAYKTPNGTIADIATDDIAGVSFQRIKLTFGTEGVATDVAATNRLPTQDRTSTLDAGSSTTPLTSNAVWSSANAVTDGYSHITGSIFSDQAGTVFIEQSADGGINFDISTSYSITASDGKGFREEILCPHARIRFVNGASAQTAFRIHGWLRTS